MIDPEVVRDTARAAAVAGELAILTLAGGWIGQLADGRLGTGPYLALAGVAVGLTTGVFAVLRTLQRWE